METAVQEKNHRRTVWNKTNANWATAIPNKTATTNLATIRHPPEAIAGPPDFPSPSGSPTAPTKFPFLGGRGGGESVAVFMGETVRSHRAEIKSLSAGGLVSAACSRSTRDESEFIGVQRVSRPRRRRAHPSTLARGQEQNNSRGNDDTDDDDEAFEIHATLWTPARLRFVWKSKDLPGPAWQILRRAEFYDALNRGRVAVSATQNTGTVAGRRSPRPGHRL